MCKVRTYVCVYKKDTMIIDEDRRFSITGRKSREDRAMLRGRIPAGGLADPMRHKSTWRSCLFRPSCSPWHKVTCRGSVYIALILFSAFICEFDLFRLVLCFFFDTPSRYSNRIPRRPLAVFRTNCEIDLFAIHRLVSVKLSNVSILFFKISVNSEIVFFSFTFFFPLTYDFPLSVRQTCCIVSNAKRWKRRIQFVFINRQFEELNWKFVIHETEICFFFQIGIMIPRNVATRHCIVTQRVDRKISTFVTTNLKWFQVDEFNNFTTGSINSTMVLCLFVVNSMRQGGHQPKSFLHQVHPAAMSHALARTRPRASVTLRSFINRNV